MILQLLAKVRLPRLPCNCKLTGCHWSYVHFSCLFCRLRRKLLGKFKAPPYWIEYVYTASVETKIVKEWVYNNQAYSMANGKLLEVTSYNKMWIDPRGHFTSLRCAIIVTLDKLMTKLNFYSWHDHTHTLLGFDGIPISEICELFANYPII